MLRTYLFAVLGLAVVGCGSGGPTKTEVSGKVSLDGKPIAEADILFIPSDKSLGADGGKIVDGGFRFPAKIGPCRVEIRAINVGPDTPTFEGQPLASNYLPARYNTDSELVADVVEDGDNKFDFRLTSQ